MLPQLSPSGESHAWPDLKGSGRLTRVSVPCPAVFLHLERRSIHRVRRCPVQGGPRSAASQGGEESWWTSHQSERDRTLDTLWVSPFFCSQANPAYPTFGPCDSPVIDLLGNLFTSLEFSDTPSVEPERELAYLSLVTPQDEAAEQAEPSAAPKDDGRTSQDTDITLVEEPITLPQSPPPLRPRLLSLSSSVLGKRSSEDRDEAMQVDNPISPSAYRNLSAFRDSTMSEERSDVTTEPSPPPTSPPSASSLTKSPRHDNQESIRRATREMTIGPEEGLLDRDPSEVGPEVPDVPQVPPETPRLAPPPLPPRKSSQKPFMSEGGSGAMMFGRQHDVSECMDNVLFQIDAALDTDKLQEGSGQSESLVKKCVECEPSQGSASC